MKKILVLTTLLFCGCATAPRLSDLLRGAAAGYSKGVASETTEEGIATGFSAGAEAVQRTNTIDDDQP